MWHKHGKNVLTLCHLWAAGLITLTMLKDSFGQPVHPRKLKSREDGMTQIQSRFLILLPFLAITMLPAFVAAQTSLLAGDEKIFPGAMCQPSDQTAKYRREPNGIMYNFDDFAQEWVCPILRDNEHAAPIQLSTGILRAAIKSTGFRVLCVPFPGLARRFCV